mmetsp:Transcript_36659/g.66455  ORF Transcript_36659/g.66455 Transcript_36659/m.66455 type:complete len:91 (-) Transcript_36659:289-561(-)|eukprot:CAMPEP_0197650710 /NCGR_PEP_ID=MMETSP1338-20131121/31113_1 /TAXON_ID=43686 ORGANISM="Pelagodinium beii, Strain RCC1491" /NCGR_SAMPLE_ID=MMETSP1338 /ASSEMBLY_ACC=CAM_ASM_000754 /LENGTH=90 /DNA_ID=CAMNT_0043225175 /DNA_START=73 /DNA_END=345 /DNA_ORIENTATION=+
MKGAMIAIVAVMISVAQLLAGCAADCKMTIASKECTLKGLSTGCCDEYKKYWETSSTGSSTGVSLTQCSIDDSTAMAKDTDFQTCAASAR